MRFIDYPNQVDRSLYEEAVTGIIDRNKTTNGLKSIVKFGNLTTPGISDIDLLFIFEKGVMCGHTGMEDLPANHKKLFTHGIMALSEDKYIDNQYYNIFSNHHLMWGEPLPVIERTRNQSEESALRIQTAVEFLIANYIDIKIQKEYGIIKLRALLQHMKGILYDLEYLNEINTKIHPHLFEIKNFIIQWFEQTPSEKKIKDWFFSFEELFEEYIQEILEKYPLYLPLRENYAILKNMTMKNGSYIHIKRNGVLLPNISILAGRTYFKLQHKFNKFNLSCPLTHEASPIIKDRFDFLIKMKEYNRQYLPNFMTITTSITAKLI